VTWGCPKGRVLGRRKGILRHSFGKNKNSSRYFVVEKSQILFWIYHRFYFVILISFSQNMEFCCNSNGVFFSKIEKHILLKRFPYPYCCVNFL
jgi:hypothetical protein